MHADQPADPRSVDPCAIPVFILCGGLGTRLRSVESRPKAIIPVAGIPFLAYTLRLLRLQGFRQIHLLLGVGAAAVEAVLSAQDAAPGEGLSFSREDEPLGTGGALVRARERAGPLNLILNGDSYAEAVYADLLSAHSRPERRSGLTLLAVRLDEGADYGALEIDGANRVLAFREKGAAGPRWINAGVYAADREFFQALPDRAFSLERDLFSEMAARGLIWACPGRFFFRDIGTPERLALAQEEFRWIRNRFPTEAKEAPA